MVGVSTRRRVIAAISLLANVCLLLVATQEWQRMRACDSVQHTAAGSPHPPASVAAGGARHLLSAVESVSSDSLLALSSSSALFSLSESPAGRRLLADKAVRTDLGTLWPAPAPGPGLKVADDLSDPSSGFSLSEHEVTWKYCPLLSEQYFPGGKARPFCPEEANAEQKWQMEWFGAHVVPGAPRRPLPLMLPCTHLPPSGYTWPVKRPALPTPKTPAVPYPNLRVSKLEDLLVFNKHTPKNLYHFDAEKYDQDALDELTLGEQFIPFASKVRLMLDVGAGGGSLAILAKRKYDVQTLSTVFADWPYCEYITERGQPCILVDVMEAMPFAKFTWDVVHLSWVFHGQTVEELRVMMHEMNRIIRPGGYLWLRGGWAAEQLEFLQSFLAMLGYGALHSVVTPKPPAITAKVFFGPDHSLPYSHDWSAIYVKPIDKQLENEATCKAQTEPVLAPPQ